MEQGCSPKIEVWEWKNQVGGRPNHGIVVQIPAKIIMDFGDESTGWTRPLHTIKCVDNVHLRPRSTTTLAGLTKETI